MPVDLDDQIIDIGPTPPKRRRWRIWLALGVVALIFLFFRAISIYVSALWFGSLGYASVYWYIFRSKFLIFLVFAALTVLILRAAFWLLERAFAGSVLERRTILINNQPVNINPARLMRPLGWAVAIFAGLIFGLSMKDGWRQLALYLNQTPTGLPDPIFQKPLGFYLFSLPVYQMLSWWLTVLAFVILAAAVLHALLSLTQKEESKAATSAIRGTSFAAISIALAGYLLLLGWRVYLARFPYLWHDHQSFSGVTYTEANYYLPGLLVVAVVLIISAVICLINAFSWRRLRVLIGAVALPVAVYLVAGMMVPAYVNSFIVKPNELGRETPYIEQNIKWTRAAFKLDTIEIRDFEAETALAGFDIGNNRATLDNIRLWDWRALQDTLRQLQEIRTYYDFPDVDVDRYQIGGQMRQVMLAARELDTAKLPEQSRNWINEKLIYTHGYGVTMNTANEFTPEGMPRFTLSNMPIEANAPEIRVTRPEIYFGQKTDTDVYVKTRQKEFNFPQGEANNYTSYEGTGGIVLGGFFNRLLLAFSLGDISKLPFSDDVTPESRLLMRRNIRQRVESLAPFLVYDKDPYIIVTADGRLIWMMDAYTESANYPYARHYRAGDRDINYIRNSVKVTVDAYNGSVDFYVFDPQDPLVNTYRATFPALFKDASEMPADVRAHVRYPETLIKTQGEVFSLYHTQNPKVFFQREDVWSVASQVSLNREKQQQTEALEPYFVLMQLPGEQTANEFVEILPFTPASRNNMIGWMAGRSDGAAYGSLLVYNFPKSRLIDGPLQIEARIDQDAQLSAQFSLWNQQGSRVRRGNLLVIPIGRSLLYVEPIYLQAERSPMPELRLVVLATQERLAFGSNFQEAMTGLFGDSGRPAGQTAQQQPGQQQQQPAQQDSTQARPSKSPQQQQQPAQQTSAPPTSPPANTQQLINRAAQDLSDYQRLTSEGKLGEAGQKLESLKRNLEELRKAQGTKQ